MASYEPLDYPVYLSDLEAQHVRDDRKILTNKGKAVIKSSAKGWTLVNRDGLCAVGPIRDYGEFAEAVKLWGWLKTG